MSQHRITRAADDVETIARRLKEIEAERAAAIAETELPSDVEPLVSYKPCFNLKHCDCAGCKPTVPPPLPRDGAPEPTGFGLIPIAREMTLEETLNAGKTDAPPSIYNQEFWQPLIDAGILELVEPVDA